MNPTFILFLAFLATILLLVFYFDRRKRTEIKTNLQKLSELLSLNQINPRDKATLDSFVTGKTYNKKQFERYVEEAKEIKQRMDAQALAAKQKLENRRNELVSKYGEDVTVRLLKQESWIGMSKDQLLDSRGEPTKIETEILKTKTKETLIYGNKSSGDYFVLENGLVSKIVDR